MDKEKINMLTIMLPFNNDMYIGQNQDESNVIIPMNNESVTLEGILTLPENSRWLVIFAHGSGSGRNSPRNQYVASLLNQDGISTLLVDLLTKEEEKIDEATREFRFNIELLANRLVSVTDWTLHQEKTKRLIIGYFGASTGAAAALIAADKKHKSIDAVVCRGGRVDLASKYTELKQIQCPVLLIVGEKDNIVVEWNKEVLKTHLQNVEKKKLVIISGATHLFEEPGKLEEVAKKASGWFRCYFQIKEHNFETSD